MKDQIEREFEEMFKKVSSQEVERNPQLRRQTEKLRRLLSSLKQTKAETTPQAREPRRSLMSIAGEYAIHK